VCVCEVEWGCWFWVSIINSRPATVAPRYRRICRPGMTSGQSAMDLESGGCLRSANDVSQARCAGGGQTDYIAVSSILPLSSGVTLGQLVSGFVPEVISENGSDWLARGVCCCRRFCQDTTDRRPLAGCRPSRVLSCLSGYMYLYPGLSWIFLPFCWYSFLSCWYSLLSFWYSYLSCWHSFLSFWYSYLSDGIVSFSLAWYSFLPPG